MRTRWLLLMTGLVLAALAFTAGACNDDDEGTSPTATTGAALPTDTPAAVDATETPAGAGTPVGGAADVNVTENADLGSILTDAEGYTLYVFANDEAGVSNCADACAQAWPPLTVEGAEVAGGEGVTGALATAERDDGTLQVTYDDQPLYHFGSDNAPGDTNGNGVADLWSVVVVE